MFVKHLILFQLCSAYLAHSSLGDPSYLPYFLSRLAPGMAYFIPVVIALATISPSSNGLSLPLGFSHQHSFYHIHCHRSHLSFSTRSYWQDTGDSGFSSHSPEWSITQPAGHKELLSNGEDFNQWEIEPGKISTDKQLSSPSPNELLSDGMLPHGFYGGVLWATPLNILVEKVPAQ